MIDTYKVLSALLSYPQKDLLDAIAPFSEVLRREKLLPSAYLEPLETFIRETASSDLYELQERYVWLFDRTRSLSLNLFEHVHGESRERGQAMIDLLRTYEEHGLTPSAKELPDYLPLFLEFLATLEKPEAARLLGEAGHVLAALKVRLEKRKSGYGDVFNALVFLAGAEDDAPAVAALLDGEDDDPGDLAALDKVWEESAVTFGPDAEQGCPVARDMLSEMAAPSPSSRNERPIPPASAPAGR
ncbi:nitrate reductase molybdenum cofactor assembly chaperone [Varunaivibrio sulfuroxidans]|uniref:Respiratory nitrate reductase chaperone NarJ n=1 Tax=Varunaivibrio sulfuroxidans TaxID=1773489 RepID=A0A4R3JBD1_9PROT|nr:nitrate reductase molybdenum cofactor assembly chaperone [Varunaivibrio sulfuroxidans]TCS62927.1 respiratory nitrate reductase chaperone NarJ [Varunaivibrio sulfuroxidans]WES31997.1 nitrate reductase molybdenum cofactor assembly chaperone [Varunaivibrio sulfuroxidans]